MAKNEWKIIGLKQLRNDLKKLPILKQARLLRNVNRKAANKIVVPKLKSAIPHRASKTGKRSKKNPFKVSRKKQVITINEKGSKTAVRSGISGDYFHYRFIEFGTKKRVTKNYKHKGFTRNIFGKRKAIRTAKKSLNRGVMPKKPFANRALDASINPLFRYLKVEYGKSVEKALKRTKKIKK